MVKRTVKATVVYLALAAVARSDFSMDQVPVAPDILSRIIAAADRYGDPLQSKADADSIYYLRSLRYIGECSGHTGPLHIAQLQFTRSAKRGSKNPPRGHQFVVFLDRDFHICTIWRSAATGTFSVRGTALTVDGASLLDFSQLPAKDSIVVDGEVQPIPRCK
jgi:hypothetical protein